MFCQCKSLSSPRNRFSIKLKESFILSTWKVASPCSLSIWANFEIESCLDSTYIETEIKYDFPLESISIQSLIVFNLGSMKSDESAFQWESFDMTSVLSVKDPQILSMLTRVQWMFRIYCPPSSNWTRLMWISYIRKFVFVKLVLLQWKFIKISK